MFESEHWLIVSDAAPSSVAQTARVLERTHDQFYREWSRFGARPLRNKLVCVSFADTAGLATYRKNLGVGAPDGRGFYSLITNRIVLCDQDQEPKGMVRTTKRRPGATRKHSRTAHEAAHQLAFNSGIQQRSGSYPAWFAEGLAGNYEPETVNGAFGLTVLQEPARMSVVSVLRANDDLIPLDEFVTMRPVGGAHPRAQVIYPQAAAFFRFLFTEYPEGFRKYQKRITSFRIPSSSTAALERAFIDAFGPIAALEQPWQRYLDRVGRAKPKRRGALP